MKKYTGWIPSFDKNGRPNASYRLQKPTDKTTDYTQKPGPSLVKVLDKEVK